MAPDSSVNSNNGRLLSRQRTDESPHLLSAIASASVEDGRRVIWHGLINQPDPRVLHVAPLSSCSDPVGTSAVFFPAITTSSGGEFANSSRFQEHYQLGTPVITPNPPNPQDTLLGIHKQHTTGQDLETPASFLVPAVPASIRSEILLPNSASSESSSRFPLATTSRIGLRAHTVNSNAVLSLTGLSIVPRGMPQNAQYMARNSGDGKRPQASRMASIESTRSNMPPSPYGEEYIKPGTPEAEPRSTPIQPEIAGMGRPSSIVRNRQIVEAPREGSAGLPSEKGFPIQIGSELFRLSGASIMSDCQYYLHCALFRQTS